MLLKQTAQALHESQLSDNVFQSLEFEVCKSYESSIRNDGYDGDSDISFYTFLHSSPSNLMSEALTLKVFDIEIL